MPVKRPANICATNYDGDLDINYDCSGPENCKYALCTITPPNGDDDCTYSNCGTCHLPTARFAALESLRNRLTRELKQLKEAI